MPREGGGQQRAGRASSAKWSWALSRWGRVWGRGGGLRACGQWTPLAALEEACHLLGMWDPSPAAVPPPGKWSFKGAGLTSLILPGDTVGPRCPGRPDSGPAQSWPQVGLGILRLLPQPQACLPRGGEEWGRGSQAPPQVCSQCFCRGGPQTPLQAPRCCRHTMRPSHWRVWWSTATSPGCQLASGPAHSSEAEDLSLSTTREASQHDIQSVTHTGLA